MRAIRGRCPEIDAAVKHVAWFARMIKDLSGDQDKLTQRTTAVDHDLPTLRSFTVGLRRDIEAVTAGLTQQYNSGAVEGTVNNIKARKMQHFGRAKHDLLRKHPGILSINDPLQSVLRLATTKGGPQPAEPSQIRRPPDRHEPTRTTPWRSQRWRASGPHDDHPAGFTEPEPEPFTVAIHTINDSGRLPVRCSRLLCHRSKWSAAA